MCISCHILNLQLQVHVSCHIHNSVVRSAYVYHHLVVSNFGGIKGMSSGCDFFQLQKYSCNDINLIPMNCQEKREFCPQFIIYL